MAITHVKSYIQRKIWRQAKRTRNDNSEELQIEQQTVFKYNQVQHNNKLLKPNLMKKSQPKRSHENGAVANITSWSYIRTHARWHSC